MSTVANVETLQPAFLKNTFFCITPLSVGDVAVYRGISTETRMFRKA